MIDHHFKLIYKALLAIAQTAQEKTHLPTLYQELQQMVEEWCQQQGIAVHTLHSWDYDYL